MTATVAGAAGGDLLSSGIPQTTGGNGGTSVGTFSVAPGDVLTLVVGQAGQNVDVTSPIQSLGGYGGGGAAGAAVSQFATGGGGGSFLFGADGLVRLVGGGGGGSALGSVGGLGGGAGLLATLGAAGTSGAGGGLPATILLNGLGGIAGLLGGIGGAGTGLVVSPSALPLGGTGALGSAAGAGGGGGFFAGGGGGSVSTIGSIVGGAGGGGAGYASLLVGAVSGAVGNVPGNGFITLIWPVQPQMIDFTSLGSTAQVLSKLPLSATGGGSGLPVVFSIDPSTTNSACTVDGLTLSLDHVGDCVVNADQAGDGVFGLGHVQQILHVTKAQTATSLDPFGPLTYGEPVIATAHVSGSNAGQIQFSVDGSPVGSPIALDQNGSASSGDLGPLDIGDHQVTAAFAPANTSDTDPSTAQAQALTISQGISTTTVSVSATTLSATVTLGDSAAPASGDVAFAVDGMGVGTSTLVDGVATLAYSVPNGASHTVSASYAGDPKITGSNDQVTRTDPSITATQTSRRAKKNGWYRYPVTVSFTCLVGSGPLSAPCPDQVVLRKSGKGQHVGRSITAVDGGAGSVAVTNINIDRVKPRVVVRGIKDGATYHGSLPKTTCRVRDALSGKAGCTIIKRQRGTTVLVKALGRDRAGNVRVVIKKVTLIG